MFSAPGRIHMGKQALCPSSQEKCSQANRSSSMEMESRHVILSMWEIAPGPTTWH